MQVKGCVPLEVGLGGRGSHLVHSVHSQLALFQEPLTGCLIADMGSNVEGTHANSLSSAKQPVTSVHTHARTHTTGQRTSFTESTRAKTSASSVALISCSASCLVFWSSRRDTD